jgi:spore germination protein YaaH
MPPQRFLQCVAALVLSLGPATVAPQIAMAAAMPASTHASVSSAAHAQTGSVPAFTASDLTAPSSSIRTAATSLRREVFGFALASSLSDPTFGYPSWNFSLLTTVAFFGLHINSTGKIVADSGLAVWNSSALTNLMATAHPNGTKVVLTIVLQDFTTGTPSMCAGLANRAITVSQTVAQVAAKGADGVNVDYEGLNGTCPNGQTARSMMTDFVRQLRAALPSSSYLSVDTYASSAADPIGFFDVPGLNANVDSFFVMAYDLEYSNWRRAPIGCTKLCLGPTAPLTGYYYNDTTTAAQYVAEVTASKVILGVPYYGRVACVSSAHPNAYPTGSVTAATYLDASSESRAAAVLPGSYVTHRDPNDPIGDERWDTWYNTSLGCTRELYFDDKVSLGLKYDLVNSAGLRGVGIWTLNYGGGAPELWSSLSNHFAGCRVVAASAGPASPAKVGTAITLTGSASGCPNPDPLYEFWILRPGLRTWQLAQAYSSSATYDWNTSGLRAGTYRFSVWVRDASGKGLYVNSLGTYDAFNAGLFYTLTSTPCAAVSVSASPSAAAMVGIPISIVGRATTCPNPLYEFWILAPGSSTWRLAQTYSSSSTFNWSTAAKPAGTYRFSVWVRDVTSVGVFTNSLGSYDAYNAGQYSTLTPGCAAVSATASPPWSAAAGTPVVIGGAASGCLNLNPVYEFWIQYPGSGIWHLAQGYSTSPAFSWNTVGKPIGIYRFSVWVHDAGDAGVYTNSLGRYDAFNAGHTFTLTRPCTSVSVSAVPSSPVVAGKTVLIGGKASGCANPLYEFWILNPGSSSWLLARGYSTSPTFSWNTTGKHAGVYRFSVWARDAGGPGVHTNSLGTYDAFNADLLFRVS